MPRPELRPSSRQRLALVVGALLVVAMLVTVLTDRRTRLAATNSRVAISGIALTVPPGEQHCQGGEFVPRATANLRLYVGTFDRPSGPPLEISIRDAGGKLLSSRQIPGVYPPGALEPEVDKPRGDVEAASVCVRNLGSAPVAFAGNLTPATPELRPAVGEGIRVDYLRAGKESWLDLAPEIARRFQRFKPSFFGAWTMWAFFAAILLLFGAAAAVQCRSAGVSEAQGGEAAERHHAGRHSHGRTTALRRARRRAVQWLPAAGWACAAIAIVNAALWAGLVPPFQVPDETFHVGYAQYLAETGRVPDLSSTSVPRSQFLESGANVPRPRVLESEEQLAVLTTMPFSLEGKPSWSSIRDQDLRRRLEEPLSKAQESGAGGAVRYSPAYYAIEAVPARAGRDLNALDRLYLMRLFSALLAGVTVAFVFLFMRELFPETPWAWTLGALAVAWQPLFGFMSGGVNNDNLLWTAGAALLYLLARASRRGLGTRVGAGIGAAAAIGFLAKPSMLAVLPGAALGIVLMILRSDLSQRSRAYRGAVAAAGVFALPTLGWLFVDVVVLKRSLSATTGALSSGSLNIETSIRGQLSYLWQFFLPRPSFMTDAIRNYPDYPVWDIYIQGFVGRFGWFQYGFPLSGNQLGLGILAGVAAAAAVALVRARGAVKRRWPELLCYTTMALGMVVLNAVAGYRFRLATGFNFEQPRYLFPVLALYGAVVVLAARAAGRRWAPSVGAFLLVLAMGHSLFAMLLTISRYYG